MHKRRVFVFLILGAVLNRPAMAACPVTYNITNGTVADATQINQNFSDLVSCAAPLQDPRFSGSVSIGTLSSSAKLHVAVGSGSIRERIETGSTGNTQNYLDFAYNGAEMGYVGFGGTANALHVWNVFNAPINFATNDTQRVTIAPTGEVGIGTINPSTKLHVSSNSGAIHERIETGSPSAVPNFLDFAYNGNEMGYVGFGGSTNAFHVWNVFNAPIFLGTNDAQRMTITAAGDVGIGTASPSSKLDVIGTLSLGGGATSYMKANFNGELLAGVDASAFYFASGFGTGSTLPILIGDKNSKISLHTGSSGATRLFIDSSGNVGIGTVSPGYLLTVNGTAFASAGAGALSDIRHKKGVSPLPNGTLDQVLRLRPVAFFWKKPTDDGMKGRQMGFIAQDVKIILPSTVLIQKNPERTEGIKYNELIAVMAKALQEEHAELVRLQAQVRALQGASRVHVARN